MLRRILPMALLLLGACNCSGPETRPSPPRVEANALPPAEAPGDEMLEPDPADDPAVDDTAPLPTESEVEAMGQPELEAACMRGSQAACDRLGH